LILESAAPLAGIIGSLARLRGIEVGDHEAAALEIEAALGLDSGALGRVVALIGGRALSADHARHLFPRYLDALERLVRYVDQWTP
jgi:hypothetical protein